MDSNSATSLPLTRDFPDTELLEPLLLLPATGVLLRLPSKVALSSEPNGLPVLQLAYPLLLELLHRLCSESSATSTTMGVWKEWKEEAEQTELLLAAARLLGETLLNAGVESNESLVLN